MKFSLKDNSEERRATEARDRLERQREHNRRQKQFAKTVGENFAAYSLVAIMMLMVASIWSDVGISTNWRKFIGDALVTVVLYTVSDVLSAYIGTGGGKLDDDYIANHEEYLSLRATVRSAGITMMNAFCDWQIDVEYEYYLRKRCKDLKIDYKEYMEQYHDKKLEELEVMFPLESVKGKNAKEKLFGVIRNVKTSEKAALIFALNQIEPINLDPDILMTDGMVRKLRGGVGMSAEEYIQRHTVAKQHIAITALFAIVAAVPVFTLVQEFTVGAVIYTIFKLALLLWRMYSGFERGRRAYSDVEPKHLQDKIKYLYLYLEFLDKKIYLELADRYDIVGISAEQTVTAVEELETN